MSQFEKSKARIMQKCPPKDIMPNELQVFMQKMGFKEPRVKGDDYTYEHLKHRDIITIPMRKPILPVYIRNLRKYIEDIEDNEEETK